jgi:transcriptional regulator with XRE-family HTH domain
MEGGTIMTLGERIVLHRRRKGLTQEELAKAVGVNKMTIWRVENQDIKDLKGQVIARLARTLGVSADYLLGLAENDVGSEVQPAVA